MTKQLPSVLLGVAICEALGFDPSKITKLSLTIDPHEGVLLHLEGVVRDSEPVASIAKVLTEYEVCPKGTLREIRALIEGAPKEVPLG